jgi:hypothetical protein
MTILELECMELLDDVTEFLTTKPKVKEFMVMMGRIRDMRYKLRNKQFGCSTGKHSSPCLCKGETEGPTVFGKKFTH